MAVISLAPLRAPRVRFALRRFAEETAAARRRAAVRPLERRMEAAVARWFAFQGEVLVRVLGATMGPRLDRAVALRAPTAEQAAPPGRLTEDLSWSDWDYLLNQVMYGNHPGGLAVLREIIAEGRTTAYLNGAAAALGDLGVAGAAMRIGIGSDAAVAHARSAAARQVTRINDTTRRELRTLITQAVEHGWSWNRTADAITDKFKDFAGPTLFPSRTFTSRAEMVAAYEIGDAYEAGGEAQARRAQASGIPMQKAWLNAGDARVRDAHRRNAEAGWIGLNDTFPDGATRPPTDPGCRCALMYRPHPDYFGGADEDEAAVEATGMVNSLTAGRGD